MDYEVFVVSRIREFWLSEPRGDIGRADNDESVALGVARTGAGGDGCGTGDVDFVRGADRRTRVVHADVRRWSDAGRGRRRHAGAHGAGTGLHATCWAPGIGGRPNRWPGCTNVSASAKVGWSSPTRPSRTPGNPSGTCIRRRPRRPAGIGQRPHVLRSETLAHVRSTTATPKALSHPWWDRAAQGSDVDMTPASSASVRMFESVRALTAEGNLSTSDLKNG